MDKLRILYVTPAGTSAYDELVKKTLVPIKRPDVEIDIGHLSKGPHVIYTYSYLVSRVMEEFLQVVQKAEKDGYAAFIIGCFGDPGIEAARELVAMPIIGPGEASMLIACSLARKFSIITVNRKAARWLHEDVRKIGLESRCVSTRHIGYSISSLIKEPEKAWHVLTEEAKKAVEEDGAEAIILGCTLETGGAKELMEELKIPVVDANIAALKYAEMMAELYRKVGLSHSKVGYYELPTKEEIDKDFIIFPECPPRPSYLKA